MEDLHSFFADLDPAEQNLKKKIPHRVEKDNKDGSNVKNHGNGPNFL